MKKKVVYTCITGDYDEPIIHKFVNPDYDYVCFTDNDKLVLPKKSPWQIRPLAYDKSDNIRNARWHKSHPHILFPEYEISLYVDAKIDMLTPKFFTEFENSDRGLMTMTHPKRNCIFQECDAVLKYNLDTISSVNHTRKFLESEKMPRDFGFAETGLMFRRHNKPEIIALDEDWWNMVKNYSYRDQLSFTYILWKNGISPKDVLIPNERAKPVNYKFHGHIKTDPKSNFIFKKIIFPRRNRVHVYVLGIKVFSYKTKKKSI